MGILMQGDFQCKIGTNIDKKIIKGFHNRLFVRDRNSSQIKY